MLEVPSDQNKGGRRMTCLDGDHPLKFAYAEKCGCVWVECTECSHAETHEECEDCFHRRLDEDEY